MCQPIRLVKRLCLLCSSSVLDLKHPFYYMNLNLYNRISPDTLKVLLYISMSSVCPDPDYIKPTHGWVQSRT